MGEWALPADEGVAFATSAHDATPSGDRPEARWLRGAIWRNFQVNYREVNDLHKQMLRRQRSRRRRCPPARPGTPPSTTSIAGQSNDCYWHGLFGGIYLPDLRVAALRRLIAAEDLALWRTGHGLVRRPASTSISTARGGPPRRTDGQIVGVKLDEGGGIGRWDLRAAGFPLAAVMRRRPEAYHETLRAHETADRGDGRTGGARAAGSADRAAVDPASIHDIVTVKQAGLSEHLHYDAYERRSGLVRVLPRSSTTPRALADGHRGGPRRPA